MLEQWSLYDLHRVFKADLMSYVSKRLDEFEIFLQVPKFVGSSLDFHPNMIRHFVFLDNTVSMTYYR